MNTKDLNKIEFLSVSIIYGIAILLMIGTGSNRSAYVPSHYKELGLSYSYFSNEFMPGIFRYSVQYFSFLLLNFCCLPALFIKSNTALHSLLIVVMYVVCGVVISVTNTYTHADELLDYDNLEEAYFAFFFIGFTRAAWLIALIVIYAGIKTKLLQTLERKEKGDADQMTLELSLGAAFWFTGTVVLFITRSGYDIIILWTMVIVPTLLLTVYSVYYLIPSVLAQGKTFKIYLGKIILLTVLTGMLIGLVILVTGQEGDLYAIILAFYVPAQLLISTPLAWYIFKSRNDTAAQIHTLQMELGKSDANLGFLKSQINPHFLFNALNTLYGTALQENAERTGEGIQKLGDMMRFMLQENMQDKISLSRDIDYLNNYIALQKLRTSVSVDILINTEIEEPLAALEITPMLLIPFVENAFKHGISLQSPSHIRITLQTKGDTLYFDVHNSIHLKADGDPEKLNSGIGLQNVKQRLALLYPKKHELIIRESAKEFFVHLTLNLK
jgi:two-component system LytT family sensor kinase